LEKSVLRALDTSPQHAPLRHIGSGRRLADPEAKNDRRPAGPLSGRTGRAYARRVRDGGRRGESDVVDGARCPASKCHRVIVETNHMRGAVQDANYHDRFRYRQERISGHGIDAKEKVVAEEGRQLRRSQVITFCNGFAAVPDR